MNVFETIQTMDKAKLADFLYSLYNKGWFDGINAVDDENFILHSLLDMDVEEAKEYFSL